MNVYEVWIRSEKGQQGWTVGASSAGTAIGRAIRYTKHKNARQVNVSCSMLAKNTSYDDWKAKNGTQS